jgi:hypothetical protein
MFRFTRWVRPIHVELAAIERWQRWFAGQNVKAEIVKNNYGYVALFREGKDAFHRIKKDA